MSWSPRGEVVHGEEIYPALAAAGLGYGPAFRGLDVAWRDGERVYAEVRLPDGVEASGHALHPALLDAALHALAVAGGEGARVPFSWAGVRLHARGATALRVRLTRRGADQVALHVTDLTGATVMTVESLTLREFRPDALRQALDVVADGLYRIEWQPADRAVHDGRAAGVEPVVIAASAAEGARAAVARTLAALQAYLAGETPILVVTSGGVAMAGDPAPDPAAAAIGGLVRSAQAEFPDRIVLVDVDEHPRAAIHGDSAGSAGGAEIVGNGAHARAGMNGGSGDGTGPAGGHDAYPRTKRGVPALDLRALLQLGEPHVAIRSGVVYVPRLVRVRPPEPAAAPWDPARTVIVTGGTGTLGALIARHLVTAHGVRHLLLLSRRGRSAPGAEALAEELTGLGASVTIAACDAADRGALAAVLASAEPPVGGVMHLAGATDDGVVASLTAERLNRVWEPKAAAAEHLDALTRALGLSAFVVFSSSAGVLGSPGQASYAAANAYLDALAAARRAAGQPAVALAWGLWQPASGITGKLGKADHARIARSHVSPLAPAQGLALLDAALATGHVSLVTARFDLAAMRADARVPALFGRLVPGAAPARPATLSQQLAQLPDADRLRAVRAAVREHTAAVLGHARGEPIDMDRTFQELAFDSLTGVELRNRLADDAGLRLPATLVFDYPTPSKLAGYLDEQLRPAQVAPSEALLAQIEAAIATGDGATRDALVSRLRGLLAAVTAPRRREAELAPQIDLAAKTDEELFELVNHLDK